MKTPLGKWLLGVPSKPNVAAALFVSDFPRFQFPKDGWKSVAIGQYDVEKEFQFPVCCCGKVIFEMLYGLETL